MRQGLLLVLGISIFLPGCSLLSQLSSSLSGSSDVKMTVVEPNGKALFIIKPNADYKGCAVDVSTKAGDVPVDCESEYLVGCDASVPKDTPFCWVIEEVGPVRNSAYPKDRR